MLCRTGNGWTEDRGTGLKNVGISLILVFTLSSPAWAAYPGDINQQEMTPASGLPSTYLNVTGTGFDPIGEVSIRFFNENGYSVTPTTTTTTLPEECDWNVCSNACITTYDACLVVCSGIADLIQQSRCDNACISKWLACPSNTDWETCECY